ncbi:3-deoxy-D-manno-octulosonic-acid transferase [Gelidibacter algens]|uniref:3-deoxy-D-manno-octulosonic acid transferase n=1 Tax=Gelidibacter algens TaxID=49280 RepID=A0A1A7R2B7_9FLAO|nr:glycosyltransferase N-terminal domain-containing protein [Gelidibacter algens]OBX25648.1 3-deoxy-D-manno-octulosonic acid transferase [Gelidibacter algens]RAJ22581.1 3-deoxy-D-manno-octulosonic-acid transferase [Gelidibacter algens]
MKLLYNIALHSAEFFLKILAFFNDKIKLGVEGRSTAFKILEGHLSANDQTFWFHCASLGEYEQGLPIFKQLREAHPHYKIVLTFFSPSGYEIRKNTPVADVVVYLPIDTPAHAKRFVKLVHPELTIFVKYDIWPNYLSELKKRHLRAILISAVFRKDQPYFKFYGDIMREALVTFEHIFVQNESSKILLQSLHFDNVSVAGDTRYDRVSDQLHQDNHLPFIESFKDGKLCVVVGSSWPEDEGMFVDYINSVSSKEVKFLIAPHTIKKQQIADFTGKLKKKTILFSENEGKNLADYQVFVVDTIGILSKIYSYADIAYVGGAMGQTGLHNILEPAVFGVPIIIGNNYKKFPEAFQMIANGGVVSISNSLELKHTLDALVENSNKRKALGELNEAFIKKNKGAVVQIMEYIRTYK